MRNVVVHWRNLRMLLLTLAGVTAALCAISGATYLVDHARQRRWDAQHPLTASLPDDDKAATSALQARIAKLVPPATTSAALSTYLASQGFFVWNGLLGHQQWRGATITRPQKISALFSRRCDVTWQEGASGGVLDLHATCTTPVS